MATPHSKIRPRTILLVDDHAVIRRGIRDLIDERIDWNCCGEATDGEEAIQKALELKPDLIVMDISMPKMNGFDATKEIKRLLPATKILILSMHNSPVIVQLALRAGADRMVVKGSSLDNLVDVLTAMLAVDEPESEREKIPRFNSPPGSCE